MAEKCAVSAILLTQALFNKVNNVGKLSAAEMLAFF